MPVYVRYIFLKSKEIISSLSIGIRQKYNISPTFSSSSKMTSAVHIIVTEVVDEDEDGNGEEGVVSRANPVLRVEGPEEPTVGFHVLSLSW